MFKPYTQPKKKAITKRLLIVNNHLSYINLIFIKYTSRYSIIILILSLYLTYRLQLFNLNCFLLLGTKYSVHLNI
jgi:hypothetical protein